MRLGVVSRLRMRRSIAAGLVVVALAVLAACGASSQQTAPPEQPSAANGTANTLPYSKGQFAAAGCASQDWQMPTRRSCFCPKAAAISDPADIQTHQIYFLASKRFDDAWMCPDLVTVYGDVQVTFQSSGSIDNIAKAAKWVTEAAKQWHGYTTEIQGYPAVVSPGPGAGKSASPGGARVTEVLLFVNNVTVMFLGNDQATDQDVLDVGNLLNLAKPL